MYSKTGQFVGERLSYRHSYIMDHYLDSKSLIESEWINTTFQLV